MDYLEWKQRLQNHVIEELDFAGNLQDKDVWDAIDRVLFEDEEVKWHPYSLQKRVREEIFRSLRRLDVLQSFIEDPSITEISIWSVYQYIVDLHVSWFAGIIHNDRIGADLWKCHYIVFDQ